MSHISKMHYEIDRPVMELVLKSLYKRYTPYYEGYNTYVWVKWLLETFPSHDSLKLPLDRFVELIDRLDIVWQPELKDIDYLTLKEKNEGAKLLQKKIELSFYKVT